VSTVLVVDDDSSTRFAIRMIIEKAGHQVVEAEHGEAALAHIIPDPLPDIVTTDLAMPVLSGEQLIERLRSAPRTAAIPIIVVSGHPAAARALYASGQVEAFVAKPFDAADLTNCIRQVASRVTPTGPLL
jgi:CheY-like chemotaxis protein